MIRFETGHLGNVALTFQHTLPSTKLIGGNSNRLASARIERKQGQTLCKIQFGNDDTPEEYFGIAYTHPQDAYVKSVGRELALEHALEAAGFDKLTHEYHEIIAGYENRNSDSAKYGKYTASFESVESL